MSAVIQPTVEVLVETAAVASSGCDAPAPGAAAVAVGAVTHIPVPASAPVTTPAEPAAPALAPTPLADELDIDIVRAPKMNPAAIFLLFLKFGLRAFGGPTVQIADQREELVVKGKWITDARFKRVYSIYNLLPGPEATELACYFGTLAGGRLGGFMGGLGFITPGFLLMLLFSWFYQAYGLENRVFAAVFEGLQPAIAALVFRAAHKISDMSFRDHETKVWDWGLATVGAMAAFLSVLNVNYFIAKIQLVIAYVCYRRWQAQRESSRLWFVLTTFWFVAPTIVYIAVIATKGKMDELVPMGMGIAKNLGNTPGAEFVIGLMAGLVTFGGAYTAIPFVQYETVTNGAWIKNQVFLDSLAVCSILPTPLVMFITMVGYMSGLNVTAAPWSATFAPRTMALFGALLTTLGMFLPAFTFPIFLHNFLERWAKTKGVVMQCLDAVAATVAGQIFVTALTLLRSSINQAAVAAAPNSGLHAVIFYAALQTAYFVPHKFTPVLIVGTAGLAGQMLFF